MQTGVPRSGDEGVTRRLKALACTAPLHDLDARKHRLDRVEATRYQMAEIALQAIDQVTLAMDFDHGADQAQVVRRLLPFIGAQAPDAPVAEHERVGRWVIENLINVGSLDRGFAVDYGTTRADGHYVRRRFDFKLLVELAGPDGEVYLRASDEAINVLVGALDTDVESAQVAAEVKLENLISRGLLGDARLAAEHARYRTVQYAEALRQKLDATRRDVRSVDWLAAVPALLDEALTHIESRYRAETAILDHIADARDEATEPRAAGRPRSWSTSCATASSATPSCRPGCRKRARSSGPSRTASSSPSVPAAPRSTCSASSCGRASASTSPPRWSRPRRSSAPGRGYGCRACPASGGSSRPC